MKHKHHIKPTHRGGTDDNSNLTKPIHAAKCEDGWSSHAIYHYCEWKLWGLREDFLAWRGLAGLLNKEEIVSEMCSKGANDMWAKLDSEARAKRCSKGGQAAAKSMTAAQKALRSHLGGSVASKIINAQRYIDPDHLELGVHNPGALARMQKRRNYPSSKSNRVRVK